MPTFQQTFANCPFPEGVLAVLGSYPVRVRVNRERRAMEVAAVGTDVSRETLVRAEETLKAAFGLHEAVVTVEAPPAPEAPAPSPQPKETAAQPAPPAEAGAARQTEHTHFYRLFPDLRPAQRSRRKTSRREQ